MTTNTLLIELGTEELPPTLLKTLATTFYEQVTTQLNDLSLTYSSAKWFATPRRLSIQVFDLIDKQEDKVVEKRGPAVNVCFDAEGNPSKAAQGWARSNGITIEQAERLVTNKGEWLLHKATQAGQSVDQLMPDIVTKALAKLPIPKPMRWGSGRTQFIRPVHTLIMMYGSSIIDGEILGVTSSNVSQGHRFHHQGELIISSADNYQSELLAAYVVADYDERQQSITTAISAAAQSLDAEALVDQELLDEVTSLVEWPVVLVGDFDKAFLDVPAEPLIYSMKDHQKYFPVLSRTGELQNKFIFVTNIESKDPKQVIFGNEKVIRPRLADAEFFFNTDKKQSLESRLTSLENVLFQKQLGTLKAKSERIASLSEYIANELKENATQAHRAGLLSKTDLMSDMVLEFPQVQGTMGKYYAQNDGEDDAVAQALQDQYRPRFAGDALPEANIGCAVAIADKIDTLVGIFGINQAPKGDKDPFALRRAAIGIIRIIIEKELPLDVADLVSQSIANYGDKLSNTNTQADVISFVLGRYRAFYQEQNVSVDIIQSVLSKAPTAPLDFDKRVKAVSFFKTLEASSTLAAANKRVGNILAKFTGELNAKVDANLATESVETTLITTFESIETTLVDLVAKKEYQAVLTRTSRVKNAY